MFYKKNDLDKNEDKEYPIIDCSGDELLTEQNHKGSVDINNIVSKQGVDRIAETNNVLALSFDTNPYNNFQEMMEKVAVGKSAFASLPAQTRDEFDNNPAKYMDYVQNPENRESLIKRGWVEPAPKDEPVEVVMMVHGEDGGLVPANSPETPPITETPVTTP